MIRRVKGFILASVLLLAATSAYARPGGCDVNCFCYWSTYSGGNCGTISDYGCVTLHCI